MGTGEARLVEKLLYEGIIAPYHGLRNCPRLSPEAGELAPVSRIRHVPLEPSRYTVVVGLCLGPAPSMQGGTVEVGHLGRVLG